jgi:hypothetical protein
VPGSDNCAPRIPFDLFDRHRRTSHSTLFQTILNAAAAIRSANPSDMGVSQVGGGGGSAAVVARHPW